MTKYALILFSTLQRDTSMKPKSQVLGISTTAAAQNHLTATIDISENWSR
jgi:hypothetical protein